jgi:hypothetical protein
MDFPPLFYMPTMVFGYEETDQNVARDLTFDAAQAARASRTETKNLTTAQIRKLLDSRHDREVLDGLRKVISVCLSQSAGWLLRRIRQAALLSELHCGEYLGIC